MKTHVARYVFCLVLIYSFNALGGVLSKGSSNGMKYRAELVADGFTIPWAMAFINNREILINSFLFLLSIHSLCF